jgi:hypothetical protein
MPHVTNSISRVLCVNTETLTVNQLRLLEELHGDHAPIVLIDHPAGFPNKESLAEYLLNQREGVFIYVSPTTTHTASILGAHERAIHFGLLEKVDGRLRVYRAGYGDIRFITEEQAEEVETSRSLVKAAGSA